MNFKCSDCDSDLTVEQATTIFCCPICGSEEEPLKEFEIWTEGYRISGAVGLAVQQGTAFGKDFNEAIENWLAHLPESDIANYNSRQKTYWGCRIFDNEADARRSFG